MERIQFYPNTQLKNLLDSDAQSRGISTSRLVIQLLQEHYNIAPKPVMTLPNVIPRVLEEVEEYVKTISYGDTFDLLTASLTFRQIEMMANGKPSTNRGTIGNIFRSKIGSAPFEDVNCSYTKDGKIEKSENGAVMYKKVRPEVQPNDTTKSI